MFFFKKNKIADAPTVTQTAIVTGEPVIEATAAAEQPKEKAKSGRRPGRPPKAKPIIKEEITVSASMGTDSGDWMQAKGQLTVDVYQTESEFCIQAPVAGVEPEDISVAIENDMLIIKGARQEPEEQEERGYIYRECYWGAFSRQILLPEDVDAKGIKASLKKGILIVKIPKIRGDKKHIKITVE